MVTHSSILAWKIPWTGEPGGLSPWGCKESGMTDREHIQPVLCVHGFQILGYNQLWVENSREEKFQKVPKCKA